MGTYMDKAIKDDTEPKEAFPWVTQTRDKASGDETLYYTEKNKKVAFAESKAGGTMEYKPGFDMRMLEGKGVFPPYHALCRSTTYYDSEI
jgi:hypothetical protein